MGQLRASEEGRSRKPRVTLERKITLSATAEGTGGLYSWQSGEGARFDSDEVSPLYENRCLTVKCDYANHRLNVDGEECCRRA